MKKFSEIEYQRPDFNQVQNIMKQYIEELKCVNTYQEMKDLFLKNQDGDNSKHSKYCGYQRCFL